MSASAHSVPGHDGTRAQHRPRIGVVGADLPRQLVHAAGAVPHRVLGAWSGPVSARASELLGAVDSVAGRVLDAILDGAHDDLAGLVVCNDSQANLRMFYVLRVLADRGEVPFPVQLLDAPRGQREAQHAFVTAQYARLLAFFSEVTGAAVDAEALRLAGAAEQGVIDALERMRERRAAGRCSGVAALQAYRIAAEASPEVAARAIDDVRTDQAEGERVFVTGSAHPDADVYEELERSGVIVVGEDHDTGDGGWFTASTDGDAVDDILSTLATAHARRQPSAARDLTAVRATALRERVAETRSGAVIALVRELDDAPAWELSAFRAALGEHVRFAARTRIAGGEERAAARDAVAELTSRGGDRG